MEGKFDGVQYFTDQQGNVAYVMPYYGNQPVQTQTMMHSSNSLSIPSDHLTYSVVVTICCCVPFGIVALVKSNEVRTKIALGDLQGAHLSSVQAKKWADAGAYTGAVFCALMVVLWVLLIVLGLSW